MQSSACILVILCLLFLLALVLYRYPSRLISHCQGWCPTGKFSRFLQKFFQILPLTVKNSGTFYWLFIPFYVSSFYCFFFFSLYVFLSLLLLFLLSLVPQVLICSFLCLTDSSLTPSQYLQDSLSALAFPLINAILVYSYSGLQFVSGAICLIVTRRMNCLLLFQQT